MARLTTSAPAVRARAARGVAGARRRDPPLPGAPAVRPLRIGGRGARRARPRPPRPHRRDPAPGRRPRPRPTGARRGARDAAAPAHTGPTHPQPLPAPVAAAHARRRRRRRLTWLWVLLVVLLAIAGGVAAFVLVNDSSGSGDGGSNGAPRPPSATHRDRQPAHVLRSRSGDGTRRAPSSSTSRSTANADHGVVHRAVRPVPRRPEDRRRPRTVARPRLRRVAR